jgi:hypothetical protein
MLPPLGDDPLPADLHPDDPVNRDILRHAAARSRRYFRGRIPLLSRIYYTDCHGTIGPELNRGIEYSWRLRVSATTRQAGT